jgi:hypothetical protein
MRLIGLAVVLTLGLILAPVAVEPQQRGSVPRIGIISALTRSAKGCKTSATSRVGTSPSTGSTPTAGPSASPKRLPSWSG